MRRFLKSMLYVGLLAGGVMILFEYFGGSAATTTSSASSTSWLTIIHSFISSPWALLSIAVIGIFVLLAVSVWRKTGEAAGGFFWNKEKNDLTPFGRLLAVIAFVIWFIFAINYLYGEPWINPFFNGLSERERWVTVVILVALAHLPLSPLANFIVPTKGAFMRAVVYTVFVVVIAYTGSRAHTTHDFFNPKTGDPTVYIDPTTNKPYHHNGWAPDTGEKLLPVTKEIAREIKNKDPVSLAKKKANEWLKDTMSKESPPPPPSPPPAPPKEEKKMIATKGKRWREARNNEGLLPSTYPIDHKSASFKRGKKFGVPPMGEGSCAALWVIEGKIEMEDGYRVQSVVTECDNQPMIATARTDVRVEWGACRAPNKWCLIFD